jgi:hypothetical protein
VRLSIAVLIMCLSGPLAFAQDDKQAVCKGSEIPPDRVVVSEFQSDGCSPPDKINAWDTTIPKEETLICEPVQWTAAADVLKFRACGDVHSGKCPSRLDGTANAMILRSPASCAIHGQEGFRFQCVNNQQLPEEDFIIGITDVERCKGVNDKRFSGNAFVVRARPSPYIYFSYCSSSWISVLPEKKLNIREVIVRRFHDEFCPEDPVTFGGVRNALNAVTIIRLTGSPERDLTLCNGTPVLSPPGYPRGGVARFMYPPERLKNVYDPLCGGEASYINGARVIPATDKSATDPWSH